MRAARGRLNAVDHADAAALAEAHNYMGPGRPCEHHGVTNDSVLEQPPVPRALCPLGYPERTFLSQLIKEHLGDPPAARCFGWSRPGSTRSTGSMRSFAAGAAISGPSTTVFGRAGNVQSRHCTPCLHMIHQPQARTLHGSHTDCRGVAVRSGTVVRPRSPTPMLPAVPAAPEAPVLQDTPARRHAKETKLRLVPLERFWCVWCPTEGPPRRRHQTAEGARGEARRLAQVHSGREFRVYELRQFGEPERCAPESEVRA